MLSPNPSVAAVFVLLAVRRTLNWNKMAATLFTLVRALSFFCFLSCVLVFVFIRIFKSEINHYRCLREVNIVFNSPTIFCKCWIYTTRLFKWFALRQRSTNPTPHPPPLLSQPCLMFVIWIKLWTFFEVRYKSNVFQCQKSVYYAHLSHCAVHLVLCSVLRSIKVRSTHCKQLSILNKIQ